MIEIISGIVPRSVGPLQGVMEERVGPGATAVSPPSDVELVTLVLEGRLTYTDDARAGLHVPAGSLYYQSAGVGAISNLRNSADAQILHLLHCLLLPGQRVLHRQAQQPLPDSAGRLRLIAAPDGRQDRLQISTDISIYLAGLGAGDAPVHNLERGRQAYLHLAAGHVFVCGAELTGGEAALIRDDSVLAIYADTASLLLLFDMPARG